MLPDVEVGALWFVGGGDGGEECFDAGDEGGEGAGVAQDEAEGGETVEDAAEVELQKGER